MTMRMKSHPAPDNTLPSLTLLRILSNIIASENELKKYRKIASKWRTEFIKVSCNADEEEKADTYLLKLLQQTPCPGQLCTEFNNTCLPQAIDNIKLRKNASFKKFLDEKIPILKYLLLSIRWFNEYFKVFCDMKCRNPMTKK